MVSYCLNMVMARIGWLPFEADFLALSRKNQDSKTPSHVTINYEISYKVLGVFKNKVDYLFSSVTLRCVFVFFVLIFLIVFIFSVDCSQLFVVYT